MFENVDGLTTDGQRMSCYTISSPGSGQLKMSEVKPGPSFGTNVLVYEYQLLHTRFNVMNHFEEESLKGFTIYGHVFQRNHSSKL